MQTVDLFLSHPVALFMILAIGGVIGIGVEKLTASAERKRKSEYWRNKSRGNFQVSNGQKQALETNPSNIAAEQLKKVMSADFKARPLLNRSEHRLFGVVEKALQDFTKGWRVMGQVSLGEILASKDRDAYFAINSKRVDLLIVDTRSQPVCALEFQGQGHHIGKTAAARDATKKEALRRAGIAYVEIVTGDTPAEVREKIQKIVQQNREAAHSGDISVKAA